jgi:hypothetical protein
LEKRPIGVGQFFRKKIAIRETIIEGPESFIAGRGLLSIVSIIQVVLDEEQETNSTNSPFKSDINKNFRDALATTGISTEDAFGKSTSGILKWFNYLTKYFMPTSPVWSNLLLGKNF